MPAAREADCQKLLDHRRTSVYSSCTFTLFPGLIGLAQPMEYELEYNSSILDNFKSLILILFIVVRLRAEKKNEI
jgi:hypothetical protein